MRERSAAGHAQAAPLSALAAAPALLLGIALRVATYPPADLWPLAFVMLAPLAALVEGRRPRPAFLLAWLHEALALFLTLPWLGHALMVESGVQPAAARALAACLAASAAATAAAALALYAALRPRVVPAAAPLLFGALILAGEWLRASVLGLPWVLAGHALASAPLLIQAADLGGAAAAGLPPAVFGAGLVLAARQRQLAPLAAPGLMLAAALGYGVVRSATLPAGGPLLRVGVVQASVPPGERFEPGSAERNLLRHADLTRELAARGPLDLVVWPEMAVDGDLARRPDLARELARVAGETGAALVTGAQRWNASSRYGTVALFEPGSARFESYDEQVLTPSAQLGPAWLGRLAGASPTLGDGGPYTAGYRLLSGPVRLATTVGLEITQPGLLRRFRAEGAALLLELSNEARLEPTGYPAMQLHHAVFRAVELRSWVVCAANTGISAVIDPEGHVVARLPVLATGTLAADVRATGGWTLYGRWGDPAALALLSVLAAAALFPGRSAGIR